MSASAIKKRIIRKGRGAVFTPSDFLTLGSRAAVDQTLSRLVKDGTIRRLTQGVYDYPKVSARIGPLSPNPDDVAKAVADKDGYVVQVSPARAANLLGLTTQVPAKLVYLTDGPTRSKTIGKQVIYMRKAAPKNLVGAGKRAGLIFQALRFLGKDGVDLHKISLMSKGLSAADVKSLAKSQHIPADWMRPIIKDIAMAA